MSRQKKKPLSQWVTAKPDGMEKRFIQIGDTLVYHPAWLALSAGAKVLYLYTVSYTHLDVYKRQVLQKLGAGGL